VPPATRTSIGASEGLHETVDLNTTDLAVGQTVIAIGNALDPKADRP